MSSDDARLRQTWNPWAAIPAEYNLGVDLTAGQVRRGRGRKPALLWENAAGAVRTYTYAQLDALSNRFADALGRLGVRRGDRVFLRLPSRPEFYVAALGIAKLGAVFIPTSPQFRESEIRYRLQDSEAVAAVSTPRLVEAVERVRADCPALQNVIVVEDEDGGAPADTIAYQSADRPGPRDLHAGRHAERRRGLHRLHLRHHRRPQGRRPPAPLPDRLRGPGALVARLPARRRGRLPVRAGLAAAGRLHFPLRPGQGADRGAVRRPGRPVQPAALAVADPEVPRQQLHRAAVGLPPVHHARRRRRPVRPVQLAARRQRRRAAAGRHAGRRSSAVSPFRCWTASA